MSFSPYVFRQRRQASGDSLPTEVTRLRNQGWSVREIAGKLGMSESSVRAALSRAVVKGTPL